MNKKLVVFCVCMLLTIGVFPIEITNASGTTIYVDDDADPEWYDATHVHTIQDLNRISSPSYIPII